MNDFMDDDDMDIRESDAQTRASEILYEELRQLPVTVAVAQALADHYAMILANQGVLVEGEYRPYGQMAEELRDAQIGRAAAERKYDDLLRRVEEMGKNYSGCEHTVYDDGARSGPRGHEPGTDLYCPACVHHDIRVVLDGGA